MRFLRRNSADDAATEDGAVDVAPTAEMAKGQTAPKGKVTPKRRDAEAHRRGPVPPPPRTQREAMKRNRELRPKMTREERNTEQRERRERMMSGDERYLMPKDRGPVKAYVRDVIDSRRNLMGLFMPLAILVLASYFLQIAVPTLPVQEYVMLACLVFLLAMVVEAIMLGRLATRLARAKFPKESIGAASLIWYTFTRASQVRKLRVPRPRVRPGEAVEA
ncbi:DUF3043 domain-containing protein [Kutzneria sp. CA-103260]|uniref:DUF3043 domain-containing protein n=1 Tax=Kutzneria sp. CA-103260 TaxID=2802641 RepID=UPI001BADE00C|nr:DUF3043 domain-containing protein [Kutzneria sp. CA-103260]QUQ67792.1 integral membrane protein [Kutzneria sp. CA-103260]